MILELLAVFLLGMVIEWLINMNKILKLNDQLMKVYRSSGIDYENVEIKCN